MPNWTDEQKNAIDSRGGTVLVSAAAGSGKTAVLVERVIERITDKYDPCDADRILVVTYTKAAATEMKERISTRLTQLIKSTPDNAALRRQKSLLERAHISTIHSFCSSIIKENFQNLDIPADFRIAEESELDVLRAEAVEEILNEMYENDDRDRFIELVEQVSSEKNDRELSETIITLSNYISSHPFPESWLKSRLEMYSEKAVENGGIWPDIVKEYVKNAISCCLEMNHAMQNAFASSPEAVKAYSHAFIDDETQYKKILSSNDFDTIYRLIHDFKWTRLSSLKGEDFGFVQENRNEQKKIVKKLLTYMCADITMHREDIVKLAPVVQALFELVIRYRRRFAEKKAELGCVDFSDLEHMTIELLTEQTEDGFIRTELAKELSKNFDEILIDEYQDTNEAQDMIFRAVSQDETNMFMVGDVKQSIYRFRQAMPQLFLEKYKKFCDYPNSYPAKITLGKNFRSRSEVTECVNFFFSQIMNEESGEIDYDEKQKLHHGAEYPPVSNAQCEFLMCDSKIQSVETDEAEAVMIANKIKSMLDDGYQITDNGKLRPAKFGDFCILLRSTKGHADAFAKTLEACGIPVYSPDSGGFFSSREVSLTLSLLGIISNPIDDIRLTAVLLSPVFSFTPDEIAEIRLCDRSASLYSALAKSAENGNEKCAAFIKYIRSLRQLAVSMPCDRLIMKIYEKTGLSDITSAMKNGSGRTANLRLLVEYARSYEKTGIGGLSGFLRFLDKVAESKKDLKGISSVSNNADIVKIMSIHGSKGLEFPICIVAGLGTQFNKKSLHKNLLIHPQLGVGMKILGSERLNRYNTLIRSALYITLEKEFVAEEMRVLYVGMTRAKEKLILSAAVSSLENKIIGLAGSLDGISSVPSFKVRSSLSFSEWLIMCVLRHPDSDNLRRIADARNIRCIECEVPLSVTLTFDELMPYVTQPETVDAEPDENVIRLMNEQAKFSYPYSGLVDIPSKVTASEFTHGKQAKNTYIKRPRFITESGLTPTEKGTALHKFMQFADFDAARENLKSELERLSELGYLSDEESNTVDLERIRLFFDSELAAAIENADEVMREMRFSCEIPVALINPEIRSADTVFLQGVADCVYRKDDLLYIVDYKTDRVNSAEQLKEMYSTQLELYARAFEEILKTPVGGKLLYSFSLNKAIEV